jgi:hypothetical protein
MESSNNGSLEPTEDFISGRRNQPAAVIEREEAFMAGTLVKTVESRDLTRFHAPDPYMVEQRLTRM